MAGCIKFDVLGSVLFSDTSLVVKSALAAVLVAHGALFSPLSCVCQLVQDALLCLCSDDVIFSLSVSGSTIVALPPCLPLI